MFGERKNKELACENSRPSSLPKRHSAGSEEGRLFSQANKERNGENPLKKGKYFE